MQIETLITLLNTLNNKTETSDSPYVVGKSYYFRTSCYHAIGTVRSQTPHELVLEPAAWVADGGRYTQTQKVGISSINEVEPAIGPMILGKGFICDAVEWRHLVPTEVK